MSSMPYPYDAEQPAAECQVAQAPEIPTAVVSKPDFPMYEMPTLMDGTFSHLAEVLAEAGLRPIGPAFALHHRAPVATADLEVGFPIDAPLTDTLTLPSGYEVTGSVLWRAAWAGSRTWAATAVWPRSGDRSPRTSGNPRSR